ncbi:toll/interleukin-1 receptor domain-containing protein [Rhodococcus sp. ZPP]|uniref:toll/interleukin-1 receptor domain-containing protein n=1 Tax=Rhodococcus sp. ZPP TaxID=2749906 RepID=UPI001AD859B8|nr:toll/interleukin-1 receptor domain-containing protein [Rhodococcus sp. ZPP]QTJ67952.1 toll/interleukin-1 receptor domain-containing protein [Rhodococcus sp. ZPP]
MIDKKSRVELVLELANKLDAQDLRWDHANIILQTYGVQPLDSDQYGPTTAETVNTATDEQLIELAQHFGLETPNDAPAAAVTTTVKSARPLFVFASHLAKHKAVVHEVSAALTEYGITLFVAHDSITVDAQWHDEIEKALDRADAGLVFLHDGFKESAWCDQEVGWLLGRHVPVMALKFDTDPYGPLGKHQAQVIRTQTPTTIAEQTVDRIRAKTELASGLGASLVAAMAVSPKFATTDAIWKHLRELRSLDANQCAQLLEATKDNNQIHWASSPWDSGRPYPRVIVDYLRTQPGGSVISSDVDTYESYLDRKDAEKAAAQASVQAKAPQRP